MSFTNVLHCGNDHGEWLNSLDFYKNEFKIIEERLQEVAQKNSGEEAMKGVEHFQNQFIVQRESIDELAHSIHEHSGRVASDAQAHAGKMDSVLVTDHEQLHEKMNSLEKVINELRHEFNEFLTKWM